MDADLLPAIERSAGKSFLKLPDLAWIADDDVMSAEQHRELIAQNGSWVATEENDEPVGFLCAERSGNRLHIWQFAIRHDRQGQGIGRGLIGHVIDVAKSLEVAAVTLTTFRNIAWNQPFYESMGFRTFDAETLPADLRAILDDEAARGLPADKRCAMMLRLA